MAQYDVHDVEVYPAEVVRVSAAFAEGGAGTENVHIAKASEKLSVPAGYKCYDVFGHFYFEGYPGKFLDCSIAGQTWGSSRRRTSRESSRFP